MKIQFPGVCFTWNVEERKGTATFRDGTTADACPHETEAYHQHATEKSTGDIDLYCWQHDLAHQIAAMMIGCGVSVVLWNIAHGLPVDTDACNREEALAQQFQRAFFLR